MARGVTIYTIGYEALPPALLLAELEAAGVRRLIDVRFRPQSRRAGMSKTKLGQYLFEHGIAYEHRRSLGTPPEIRVHFHAGRTAQGRREFAAYIEQTASDELDDLAESLATDPPTALMCLEAEPAVCHRRVLTEALQQRRPGLQVVDLGALVAARGHDHLAAALGDHRHVAVQWQFSLRTVGDEIEATRDLGDHVAQLGHCERGAKAAARAAAER